MADSNQERLRRHQTPCSAQGPLRENDDDDIVFPLPGYSNPKDLTLSAWLQQRLAHERQPFQPMWDEALRRIAAGEFRTLAALAGAYGKPAGWAARLRAVAVGQRVMTHARWKACFRGWRHTASPDATLTARPTGAGRRLLGRDDFEAVFRAKQDCLTVDFVVQLLRVRCWRRVQDFAAHFHRPSWWGQAFRRLVLRERMMTVTEWRACFSGAPLPLRKPSPSGKTVMR